jgi:aldehyde dehydrogenase (NAD+)
LIKFDDIEDVIARANASDYGLGGSVWGTDVDKAFSVAQRIASGTVWVNEVQHLSPLAAFGGMKQSGVGVEGGLEGLLEYTSTQTLTRKK